jgi:hypothetical protein
VPECGEGLLPAPSVLRRSCSPTVKPTSLAYPVAQPHLLHYRNGYTHVSGAETIQLTPQRATGPYVVGIDRTCWLCQQRTAVRWRSKGANEAGEVYIPLPWLMLAMYGTWVWWRPPACPKRPWPPLLSHREAHHARVSRTYAASLLLPWRLQSSSPSEKTFSYATKPTRAMSIAPGGARGDLASQRAVEEERSGLAWRAFYISHHGPCEGGSLLGAMKPSSLPYAVRGQRFPGVAKPITLPHPMLEQLLVRHNACHARVSYANTAPPRAGSPPRLCIPQERTHE